MSKNNTVKEPLFHISKRTDISAAASWRIRIIAVAAALLICGIALALLTGDNIFKIYSTIISGAVGSPRKIWSLSQETAMLLCVGLAVTPAFKMKFWNIGAEGQVLIGGLATVACMMFLGDTLPTPVLYIVMIAASILAAAIWAFIPGFFKAIWNTNETLFTLMMNYVAIQLVSYYCGVFAVPKGSGSLGTIATGQLPVLFGKNYLLNILVVLLLTVGMYVYLKYSKHGYELSVVGESENTAKYIGINVKKVIMRTALLSGAICGIAGLLLVAGTNHSIDVNTADNRGFTAILVSWLGKFNPVFMIFTSLLICFLDKGASNLSTYYPEINTAFADIVTGLVIFFIIGSEFFINYKVVFNKSKKGDK